MADAPKPPGYVHRIRVGGAVPSWSTLREAPEMSVRGRGIDFTRPSRPSLPGIPGTRSTRPGGRVTLPGMRYGITDPLVDTGQPDIPVGGTGGGSVGSQLCALLPEGWARTLCELGLDYTGLGRNGGGGGSGQTERNPFTGLPGVECTPPFIRDPVTGECRLAGATTDPTPGTVTPAEASVGVTGVLLPSLVGVMTHVCPKYADGKKGILWMNALTGQVVCLPRGVNGKGFGLIRKNKPRRKPYISAAEKKHLDVHTRVQKKARDFASAAGYTCKKKGSSR